MNAGRQNFAAAVRSTVHRRIEEETWDAETWEMFGWVTFACGGIVLVSLLVTAVTFWLP